MDSPVKTDNKFITDFFHEDYSNLQYKTKSVIARVNCKNFLSHIKYTAENSPFYRKLFNRNDINIKDIKTVQDISRLPFTTKHDLNNYNEDFLAVNEKKIIDICLTSATSGKKPTILKQTASDLSRLAYNEKIAFSIAGITEKDTMVVCAALDRCFMAGIAYFMGGTSINAAMVRAGSGNAAQIWELIKLTKTTCIVGVPSLMIKIADYAISKGENPFTAGISTLIGIGEPLRDKKLKSLPSAFRLEKIWNADIYSTYASTEIATSFAECSEKAGGHIRPELIIVEIVDEKGNTAPPGHTGEVVVTPLGVKGMPLIRFKTGDISFIIDSPCKCGRLTKRLGPVLGRKNQMLKYKGTTIFPNSMLASLSGKEYYYGGYIEARKNSDGTDRVILYIALKNKSLNIETIKNDLRAQARVVPEIIIISMQELDKKVYGHDKRKKMDFIDLRKK